MSRDLVDQTAIRPRASLVIPAPVASGTSPKPAITPDGDVLDRLARGDVTALDAVLAEFWAPLVVYLVSLLGSRDAAEDVAQETFYRLWERRTKLRADGSLRGFLYQVARNLAITEHRRDRALVRAAHAMQEEQPPFVSVVLEDSGLHEALNRAIADLPCRRREILVLHSVHGLSYKEIATLLGIAPQTVANQFSAALSSLRNALIPASMV